jgi:hypothetical protein
VWPAVPRMPARLSPAGLSYLAGRRAATFLRQGAAETTFSKDPFTVLAQRSICES